MTTMWGLFCVISIVIILADKSFETCTYKTQYEANCTIDEIKYNKPLKLNGSERKLILETETTELPPGTFKLLPNLEKLTIEGSGLRVIYDGAFQNLKKLTELTIRSLDLIFVRENIFDDCPNLKHLDLYANQVGKLGDDIFGKLTQLEELNLSSSHLEKLPKTINNLSRLKVLNVKYNRISMLFANNFSGLKNLEILILGYNRIERIQKDAFKGLTKLKLLDLKGNKMDRLDVDNIVTNLPKLETIQLDVNVFDCTTLKTIIEAFKNKNINVPPGNFKTDTAVNGMDCRN